MRAARRDFAFSKCGFGPASLARLPGDQAHSSAAAHRRGEASSQRRSGSRFTRHEGGLPQRAHGAGRAAPRVTMDPQEEVRAAQDEVKQLKAQLAALQQLQASPPKLRQGLKIPGLKNTGTTLNYIADGAGFGDDPLNRPRRSPPRRPQRGGPSEEWWNWELVDAPKPKANLRRGVQATNLLQPQWPQPRVAPAISRDATPPLLPGWKEPSYKSPMAVTEPNLRVGLQIPSLDEARRKPEAHHTVASKKFSVSCRRRRPRKIEFTRNLGRRRASRPTRSRRNGGPRRRSRGRRFPVVPHQGPRIVDIEPDYKPGPRTAARRRVHARRSDVQLPALQRKTRRRKKWYTPPPAPSPRRYLGPVMGGRRRRPGRCARTSGELWSRGRSTRGWRGHCNTATTRARRASSASATGGRC